MRYLPGLATHLYQGQLKGTLPKRAYADDTFKDLKMAEFTIQLLANQYMNFHSVHLVFPLKIKKKLTLQMTYSWQKQASTIFWSLDKGNWY